MMADAQKLDNFYIDTLKFSKNHDMSLPENKALYKLAFFGLMRDGYKFSIRKEQPQPLPEDKNNKAKTKKTEADEPPINTVVLLINDTGYSCLESDLKLMFGDMYDELLAKKHHETISATEDDEPFLVHNSDILTNIDLRGLYQQHIENEADATLLVGQRDTSRYLIFNHEDTLCGWINKKTGEQKPEGFCYNPAQHEAWAFGGIHVISPMLLHYMRSDGWSGKFSIIPFYLSVCQKARIMGSPIDPDRYWFDIGKIETLEEADHFLKNYEL